MRAHRTATTVPGGSLVVSLSVPARGITASTDAVSIGPAFTDPEGTDADGMVEAFTDALPMATVAADTVIAVVLHADRLEAAFVEASPGVVSTVAVSTVEDIGK